ncbi:MAG TPA: glycosyltransferase [Caulobacteraceae bacterium]
MGQSDESGIRFDMRLLARAAAAPYRAIKFVALIKAANSARDARRYVEAANLYSKASALAPDRIGLRIQLANMLKDSGRFEHAEAVYLGAISRRPNDADAHLQLARLRKITGRRELALEGLRRALELAPDLEVARQELLASGDAEATNAILVRNFSLGGLDALLGIRGTLDGIARQVSAICSALPDALSSVAFPPEAYAEMRALFDVPPAETSLEAVPDAGARLTICIVVNGGRSPDPRSFQRLLQSAISQTYSDWRLLVIGSDPEQRAAVERLSAADPRVRWLKANQVSPDFDEYQAALQDASDWAVFLPPNGGLHERALEWVAAVAKKTGCHAIVFDEEGEDELGRRSPTFRRIVDVDTLRHVNVFGDGLALCTKTLSELSGPGLSQLSAATRKSLLLAFAEHRTVAHVPLPLIRRFDGSRDKGRAIGAHSAGVKPRLMPSDPRSISVIIPSKDNFGDLCTFTLSLQKLAADPRRLEIVVVNNGDSDYREALKVRLPESSKVRVVDCPEPFNWSRLSNFGASVAKAPILVFANDDMKMLSSSWDLLVDLFLRREDVGALGAKLLYPDYTIQHAGILFNWNGAVIHDGLYEASDVSGPALRFQTTRAVSAVTGAFLATRREDFFAAGGFDERHLPISYSDIDYCLKLREKGMKVLWTPDITATHYESKSRGLDFLDPAKAARDEAEREVMRHRWPGILDSEPSLNPFWRQAILPHRLIGWPSREQVWTYVQTSAMRNPWSVKRPPHHVRLRPNAGAPARV